MEQRRLAAIMFTDIVGYTALMGENEPKALQLLEKNRKIQKPLIEIYRGQLLKEMGDGMLASFTSVSDAVHCAQEILRISKEEPDLKLHIGIHLGEVIFSDGDVFGDGVNIASRIESTAKEGEIYISEDVWKNIKNKETLPVEFIGKKTFKNVKEPVGLYKIKEWVTPVNSHHSKPNYANWKKIGIISTFILIFAIAVYILFNTLRLNPSTQLSTSDKSIALLPLQNISDEGNDYLANGIQSQIATYLYKIPGIKVYEGMDIEAFLAQHMTKDEISKELNLSYILEGSLLKEKNRFKLELKLEDLNSNKVVSFSYDKNYDLIMDVLSDVAEDVAKSIQIALNAEEKIQLETRPTKSPIAYDLYLRAVQTVDEARKAFNSTGEFPFALADSARALALKALEIDPDFMDPQMIIFEYEWELGNIDTARIIVDKMIKIHPERWEPYENKAELLFDEKEIDHAFRLYKKSFDINPGNRYINLQLGRIYCYYQNDFIKGIPHLVLANELSSRNNEPRTSVGHYNNTLAMAYMSIGDYEKALEVSKKGLLAYNHCSSIFSIFWNYIFQSMQEQSLKMLDSLCEQSSCKNCKDLYYYYYIQVGDFNQAKKYTNIDTSEWFNKLWTGHMEIKTGNLDIGNKLLREVKSELEAYPKENNKRWGTEWQFWLAIVYEKLGEKEKALEWLRACEKKGFWFGSNDYMMNGPVFESLKTDPQFLGIYQKAQGEKAEIRAKIRELKEKGEFEL